MSRSKPGKSKRGAAVLTASAFLFLASIADTAGTCDFRYYGTRNSNCGGGQQTAVIDGSLPAADAAACASMCGCVPAGGSQWRYGCVFTPDPR